MKTLMGVKRKGKGMGEKGRKAWYCIGEREYRR
jgi:hypothetical protein